MSWEICIKIGIKDLLALNDDYKTMAAKILNKFFADSSTSDPKAADSGAFCCTLL